MHHRALPGPEPRRSPEATQGEAAGYPGGAGASGLQPDQGRRGGGDLWAADQELRVRTV